jgi:Bacterial Ig-like domain (group 3)
MDYITNKISMSPIRDIAKPKKWWLVTLLLSVTGVMSASTKARMTQLVVPASTVTSLAEPTGAVFASTVVPLTIAVTSSNGPIIPSGEVILTDNSKALGNLFVDDGAANFNQIYSDVGNHLLVACYDGAANFSPSCSAPINISVLPPYLLTQTKSSGSADAPKAFEDDLRVIPTKGFSGVVQLKCQASSFSCSLSPSVVSLSGDGKAQIVKAVFTPVAASPMTRLSGLPIVGILGVVFARRRRRYGRTLLFLCGTCLLCIAGCGPIISIPVSNTTQTMVVTSTSGSYSQAVTYQIEVVADAAQ